MRRSVFAVLAAVMAMALSLAACGGADEAGGEEGAAGEGLPDTITIGVTAEKTGHVTTLGVAAEGIERAADYINANGGIDGKQVKVVVRDNAGTPAKAVSDLRTFAQEGTKIVLGGVFGPNCAAEAPVAIQSELLVFCLSTDDLPEQSDHMFGIGTGYRETIRSYAEMMARYSERTAVFADKEISGDHSARQAPENLKEFGNDPILIRTDPTASSFKPAIQKAIADGADGLWFSQCTPAAISAVGEAKSLRFRGRIALSNCFASVGVAQALKELVGTDRQVIIQVPSMFMPDQAQDEAERTAIEQMREGIPGPPDVVKAAGWDSLFLVKQLLEQTKTLDVAANIEALEDGFSFLGAWHGTTYSADDHRGAAGGRYLIPAYFTDEGSFAPLDD